MTRQPRLPDTRTPEQKLEELREEFDEFRTTEAEKKDHLIQSMMGILNMYLALGENTITVLCGKNSKAEVKFHGPINAEVISDLMAHLGFYRRYFPKDDEAPDCLTAEKLIAQFREIMAGYQVPKDGEDFVN